MTTTEKEPDKRLSALLAKDWKRYKDKRRELKEQQERLRYNIVSVSTYTGHLENYHSDVWGFLLDPTASHKMANLFLLYFCNYLKDTGRLSETEAKQFQEGRVLREKGRIDVCIVDKASTACIIIENKINNAVDQDKQLERYYAYAVKNKLEVKAMLYVSARGERLSTLDENDVVAVAACNHTERDLLHGWLLPAKRTIPHDGSTIAEDISSFLHQYSLLLQQQSFLSLQTMTAKTLYDLLNNKEDLETASMLEKELATIKLYRCQVFSESMGANYFFPFKKMTSYPGYVNHLIFKDWVVENRYRFQFDIVHYRDHTRFVFYETNGKMPAEEMRLFLTDVFGEHSFVAGDKLNHTVHFHFFIRLGDDIDTLEKLDRQVVRKAKELFGAMKNFQLT